MRRFDRGQIDFEPRPPADLTIDIDESAVAANYSGHGRQAESGPLPVFFGRKERVEDLGQILVRDSHARVNYPDGDVFARLRFDIHSRVMFVYVDVLRLDPKLSPLWHRVARVDAEIHQHLMELCRVARDAPQFRVYGECDLDVFRHRVGQDFDDFFDQAPRLQRDVFP